MDEWPSPDRAWLVRGANVDGSNLVPEWLEDGYVSVGWDELGDLDPGISRDALADRVRGRFPGRLTGAQRAAVGNLNRFVNLMQPGHLVLTADRDSLYVGRVTADRLIRRQRTQTVRLGGELWNGSTCRRP